MPNVRSQEVTKNGITIVASDGRVFSVTRAEIVAFWQTRGGSAASRKSATISWVRDNIVAALGAEQVPAVLVTMDFDTADLNRAMLLEILSG